MNNKKKFKNSYKLFEKSKRFIPLAAQTFSKSSMNFVFGASPLFISRGKGAFTWDIDNNKFIVLINSGNYDFQNRKSLDTSIFACDKFMKNKKDVTTT